MTLSITNSSDKESFDEKQKELIKDLFFKGNGTDQDFALFLHVCTTRKLDPFMRQIFPVFRKIDKKFGTEWKKIEVMTLQTGIDGYRLIADRTGNYAPGSAPTFTYVDGKIFSSTAYVKKMTNDGTWHEIAATAYWEEYVQKFVDKATNKQVPTKFWLGMPHNQLSKCAEALAIRKAFPAELSGIYSNEEMEQASNVDISVEKIPQEPKNEVIPVITPTQAEELRLLKSTSSDDMKIKVENILSQKKLKSFKDLPATGFDYIKTLLLNNQSSDLTKDSVDE